MFLYSKYTEEIEKLGLDFTDRLATGDSLTDTYTITATLDGVDASAAVIGSHLRNNNIIYFEVKSGTPDSEYIISIIATTANAMLKKDLIKMTIKP